MWKKESTYVERTDRGPRFQDGCALKVSREGRMGAVGLRDAVESAWRALFHRVSIESVETYLHYRFLRKRAPSCTIGRGMRDRERMDRERTGWKRHRARGVLIEGWLGVTSTLLPLAQNQRMHAYIGKTPYQRPLSTRSRLKSLTFAFQKPAF